jgi:hypothetical protein
MDRAGRRSTWTPLLVDRGAGVLKALPRARRRAHQPGVRGLNDKAPYDGFARPLVARLDEQMAAHRKRRFDEKARVLDYFQKSRDILLKIRRAGGLPAGGVPNGWIEDDSAPAIDASRRTHSDKQLGQFLQPLPAVTPDEALKTFETVGGFRMELVAAEPLLQSPVAAAFDADGNLYVAEMRDYPYKPKPGNKPLGTVRLCATPTATAGSTRARRLADGLLWAAGIGVEGGVFVTAPPDIWYLKDTDGDFRRRAPEGLHGLRHREPAGDGQ